LDEEESRWRKRASNSRKNRGRRKDRFEEETISDVAERKNDEDFDLEKRCDN